MAIAKLALGIACWVFLAVLAFEFLRITFADGPVKGFLALTQLAAAFIAACLLGVFFIGGAGAVWDAAVSLLTNGLVP